MNIVIGLLCVGAVVFGIVYPCFIISGRVSEMEDEI